MLSWIATAILTFFVGFTYWATSAHPALTGYAAMACFALAALLMLPPLWRSHTDKRAQRVRYIAAAIFAVAALMMPIKTTAIKLNMPSASSHP